MMMDEKKRDVAFSVRAAGSAISGSLSDALTNEDGKNIASGLDYIGRMLRDLGNADAATPMGAIEGLGLVIKEGLSAVASSNESIAEALSEITSAIRERGDED
jgi:hypothetical protein